jgi:hypothetical protein
MEVNGKLENKICNKPALSMITFQAMLYKVIYIDSELGWDYSGDILFESAVCKEPIDAMVEFSFCEPSHPNWVCYFENDKNGEILEEQIFDASVIEID